MPALLPAQQMRDNTMNILNLKEIAAQAAIATTLMDTCGPLVEGIKEATAKVIEGKNAADNAKTEKNNVWKDVLTIVGNIVDATSEAPALRDWACEAVLGEFLHAEKESPLATVKAYASTGKAVAVKLVTEQGMQLDTIKEMSYGDIRATINPPANRVATNIADELAKLVKYIARHGDAQGVDATAELTRLRGLVTETYNTVKSSKESKSAAAKLAKELRANKQQAPSEASTVETSRRAA